MNYQSAFRTKNQHLYGAPNSNSFRTQVAPQRESCSCRKSGASCPPPLCSFADCGATGTFSANSTKTRSNNRKSPERGSGNSGCLRPKHCANAQLGGPLSRRESESLGRQVWKTRELESLCGQTDSGPRARAHIHNSAAELGHRALQRYLRLSRATPGSAKEHQKCIGFVPKTRTHSTHTRPFERQNRDVAMGKRPRPFPGGAASSRAGG